MTNNRKNLIWTPEAEESLKRVPFFVRQKAKKSIEQYVLDKLKLNDASDSYSNRNGAVITIEDVKAAKEKFLSNMSKDIKGYQADRCFGASGCSNSANGCGSFLEKAENILKQEDILSFLKQNVKGDLKYHHEFRLSCTDCPNCCSQPQIKDFGVIGAVKPKISDEPCTQCNSCVNACPDNCITFPDNQIDADNISRLDNRHSKTESDKPTIDFSSCMMCNKCIETCPTGTICEDKRGFKVLLAGRLGRHPRLAIEINKILSEDEAIKILKNSIKFYKKHSKQGERFAKIFNESDIKEVVE